MEDYYEDPYLSEDEDLTGTLRGLSESLAELTNPSTTVEALQLSRDILSDFRKEDPEEDAIQREMKAQSERTREILRQARERIAARKFDKRQLHLAAAQGWGAPTRAGSFAESVSNMAGQVMPVRKDMQQFRHGQEDSLNELDMAINSTTDRELAARLQMLMKNRETRARLAQEALKTLGKRASGSNNSTQGRAAQAVDRAFAPEYVEFVQGGAAEAAKALEELKQAHTTLVSGKNNITGPVVGTMGTIPLIGKVAQDIFNPEASDVQETVEYTVQQSLRPILGAQFTEKEGERLIARVYNRRLDESVNAERLDRLINQLQRAYEEKQRAAEYFEQHGTLSGFEGKTSWTIDDIWPASDGETTRVSFEEEPEPAPRPQPIGKARKKRGFRWPWQMRFAEGGQAHKSRAVMTRVIDIDGQPVEIPVDMSEEEARELYYSEDPSLGTTALEAAVTGGLGYAAGKAGSNLVMKGADALPGRRIKGGEKRVLDLMDFLNVSPDDIAGRLQRLNSRLKVPANVMDVMPPEMRALGEASFLPRAKETGPTLDELRGRQKDSRGRVAEQVNQGLVPDAFTQLQNKLKNDRSLRGRPLYDEVFKQYPEVQSKVLNEVLDTKEGSRAVKSAVRAWKKKYKDKPFGKPDATGMARSYSLEFLDLVKYFYDDEVRRAYGRDKPKYAELVKADRDRLRDELDALTGGDTSRYRAARNQWEYDSKLMEALDWGHNEFSKVSPGEAAAYMKDLDFTTRDVVRSGVAESLLRQLQGPYTDTNPAKKIVGSPDLMEKLELLFVDDPRKFALFKEALEAEMEIFENTRSTLNKGKSSRGEYQPPTDMVKQMARERVPTLGPFNPYYWLLKSVRHDKPITEAEADQILRILRTRDPAYIEKTLGSKFRRSQKRKKRAGKFGAASAAAGALLPFLAQNESESDVQMADTSGIEITDEEREVVFPGWSDEEIRQYKISERPAYAKGGGVKKFHKSLRESVKERAEQMRREVEENTTYKFNAGDEVFDSRGRKTKILARMPRNKRRPEENLYRIRQDWDDGGMLETNFYESGLKKERAHAHGGAVKARLAKLRRSI